MWWRKLSPEIVDAITLEPICTCRVEPFRLGQHYFEAEALAAYLVASGSFVNPLNREDLSAAECEALDAHLVRVRGRRLFVARSRTRALEAVARGEDPATAAEAASVLQSLFQPGRTIRQGLDRDQAVPPPVEEPRGPVVDWRAAIRETRAADEARRTRRAAEARAAEHAAQTARLAAIDAIVGSSSSGFLRVVDEIKKRGEAVLARERRDLARQAWPDELLDWATKEERKVKTLEDAFQRLLDEPARCRDLAPQRKRDRRHTHVLAEAYGFETESFDRSPQRHIRLLKPKQAVLTPPGILLSDAARDCALAPPTRPAKRRPPRPVVQDHLLQEAIRRSLQDAATGSSSSLPAPSSGAHTTTTQEEARVQGGRCPPYSGNTSSEWCVVGRRSRRR